MRDVGKIAMRSPKGFASQISVAVTDAGSVDIVVNRSSEGEALIRLPVKVAKELSELLAAAVALSRPASNSEAK